MVAYFNMSKRRPQPALAVSKATFEAVSFYTACCAVLPADFVECAWTNTFSCVVWKATPLDFVLLKRVLVTIVRGLLLLAGGERRGLIWNPGVRARG